ncbi:MAG: sigma-54 dependent transcriptional regulator [Acidobacteria bacterium]|nr:sigma-54 dependent transcriptional regulator [Acidobacteriota bacterium]MCI0722235.1 sigma-54 dependent transcriptional regulator [Acidobacteriota bacterium]
MVQPRIIILDEGPEVGAQLKAILDRPDSFQTNLVCGRLPEMGKLLKTSPDLLIPVLPLAAERAQDLVAEIRTKDAGIPVLAVVKQEHLDKMLDILHPWIKDFLVVPLQEAEVRVRVRRLVTWLSNENSRQVKDAGAKAFGPAQLVGEDPSFMAVKNKIRVLARFESPVLLTGETGTGKEMCARALHYSSRRAGQAFLPVNCGAIPVELFENELFGHQKGAFTTAWAAQTGLIEEAEGGTLFLDEIETLSLAGQVKLLRFLEDQSYYVLGSPRMRRGNVWIIASTNVELARKVGEGTFREDLYYRLAVSTLALPPLRLRQNDISLLAEHFFGLYAEEHRSGQRRLSLGAEEALRGYSWPGNVRELANVIRQLIMFVEAQVIEPEHLPIPGTSSILPQRDCLRQAKVRAIEQFEKSYVTELLKIHKGNVTHAAREAKKDRRAFGRLIKKYQITTQ